MDYLNTIKNTELFRNMPDEDLQKVSALCHEKQYAKDECIMEEGSAGDEVFIIPSGLVGIDIRVGENMYRQNAYQITQGDVFGELALFGHKRSARVKALEDVSLLYMSSQGLNQLMREVPRVGYYVMTNLSKILAERLMMSNIPMEVRK